MDNMNSCYILSLEINYLRVLNGMKEFYKIKKFYFIFLKKKALMYSRRDFIRFCFGFLYLIYCLKDFM